MTAKPDFIHHAAPLPYGEALELMRGLHAERVSGHIPDTVLMLQHLPVVTLGRNARDNQLKAPEDELKARGVEVVRVERGGQATCHFPGQLVAYPVIRLKERNLGVRSFVAALEDAMEAAAAAFGVATERIEDRPGIYRGAKKVGSVGVAVKSGVSLHGLSLNVSGDLSLFDAIIACGEHELKPASLCSLSGRRISLEEAAKALEEALSKALAATPR